jgi:signal transduction histidine kinase
MATAQSSPRLAQSKPAALAADYNLRILWPIARYFEERFGDEGLQQLAAAGGLVPSDFDATTSRWVSAASFEAILARARALLDSEDEFMRACVHRIKEAYGPLRYVLWATSPGGVFNQAASQYSLVSTCGDLVMTPSGPTATHCHFTSRVPFSRLACLARQAQGGALPTFWGLPPAYVKETACVGRGDPSCELDYHWYTTRRWLPTVLGALMAALCGWALSRSGLAVVPTPVMLGVLGAALGYLFEVRRTERVNERTREEVMGALRDLARDESDARRELLGMHQRQKDWTRLVEEEMNARAAAVQAAVSGGQEVQSARASTLLGFSHDLRNPLQVIRMSIDYLRGCAGVVAEKDAADSIGDMDLAVERMSHMLGDLVRVTQAQRAFVPMAPQAVAIPGLTNGLRRRLRALVHGRNLRSTVSATREAPEVMEMDPLALDRILDNLLTNAAKYTERGSIDVVLDGTPGHLVLKVSDTGCGIPAESLGRIFEAGGSSPRSRRGDSFGVGLSVVVQLLDQIGGRLEVMSRPDAGTTFWVYLPLVARCERPSTRPSSTDASSSTRVRSSPETSLSATSAAGGALGRVVTIRHLPS